LNIVNLVGDGKDQQDACRIVPRLREAVALVSESEE
jgi:hypothetical protein